MADDDTVISIFTLKVHNLLSLVGLEQQAGV